MHRFLLLTYFYNKKNQSLSLMKLTFHTEKRLGESLFLISKGYLVTSITLVNTLTNTFLTQRFKIVIIVLFFLTRGILSHLFG